jgi:hypothetical protein
MKVNMSYDYDDDGDIDPIYSRIYKNGSDYDIANLNTWRLSTETNYLTGTTYYYRSLLTCDFNLDGKVDYRDASILGANWLRSGKTFLKGDANGDGKVNDKDAAILAAHWHQDQRAPSGVTILNDRNGKPIVTIYEDGHREIHVYPNGMFTVEDVLTAHIMLDGDVILEYDENGSITGRINPDGSYREAAGNEPPEESACAAAGKSQPAIAGDPDAAAIIGIRSNMRLPGSKIAPGVTSSPNLVGGLKDQAAYR